MSERKNKLAKRARPIDIISHWPKLIENLQFSPQEFYRKVEAALAKREIPDVRIERVDWKEGGPLSARREYLRITRERVIFDVCGAPFGTGFFVSVWHGERPLRFGLVAWCLLLLSGIAALGLLGAADAFRLILWHFGFRMTSGDIAFVLATMFAGALLGFLVIVGPHIDRFLMQTPLVGYFHERFFRRITLYRVDLSCMYLAAIHAAVAEVVDEIGKVHGIAPLSELERKPVFRELVRLQGSNGDH